MYKNLIKAFDDTLEDKIFENISFNIALSSLNNSTSNLKFLIGEPGIGKSFLLNKQFENILTPIITKEDIDINIDNLVIDEAQLLDDTLVEYIRILSDKGHKILLSMHTKDAKKFLEKEHFKSRNIDVVELQPLAKEDMIKYINFKLISNNINMIISKKDFDLIYKYTKGNFRYVKKMMKTIFELLQFAMENNLKYNKVNKALIIMSAIHLGLEDA